MAAVIAFFQSHGVVLAALGVAILDFIIELVPSIKSNSLISLLLSVLGKVAGGGVQPPAA
jgi:hypothetical protein